jgi:hypothetical protein
MLEWLSSGPAGLLAGSLLGLVLGVFFEDMLKKRVKSVGMLLRRWTRRGGSAPDLSREFKLGALRAPCVIVEGDGEHEIDRARVRVLVNPIQVRLPDELSEWRDEVAREQARRKAAGDSHAWNGANYAVDDLIVSRAGPQELPEVTLVLKHSDYFTFLATQQLDRRFPGGATPRTRYLEGRELSQVPDFMRSCFGLNVAVVTCDDWLLVSRRSSRVVTGKGQWNSSANEGLSRDKDSAGGLPPDLFEAAGRGLREELQLSSGRYDLHLLAFHVVTSLSQWGALFVAQLKDLRRDGLQDHLSRGVEDGWEHPEFDFVSFDPESSIRYLLREDRIGEWAPAAPVLIYLSLVHAFGRAVVDGAADRVLREAK